MVKQKKIQKDDILKAAVKLLQKDSSKKLTARNVAFYLDSSTQPIYNEFKNMSQLKDGLFELSYDYLKDNVFKVHKNELTLSNICFEYIRFAKEDPMLFNSMFNYSENYSHKIQYQVFKILDELLPQIPEIEDGLTEEEKAKFKQFTWPAIHGFAVMINQGVYEFKKERIHDFVLYHIDRFQQFLDS